MQDNTETPQAPEPAETPAREEPLAIAKEARELSMLIHLLGIVGFFAPLVIWLHGKDKDDFVNEHGRAAMNYQVSIIMYYLACWILCFVIVGIFLLIALIVMHIVFVILGAVRAYKGKPWQYPIAIRFLK
ncbi:MAG: DUF4870 domain-containing protein [Planctomycetota bacterium]|jgi:uncharacterized Tic20 family protein